MRLGVFPGSFNPATVAHLAIGEAALRQCALDRVEFVISVVTLGKQDDPHLAPVDDRLAALQRLGQSRPWLGARVTEHRLLADIAEGYDVIVLGADKWAQVTDPVWYGGVEGRDAAVARLPQVAIAPRPPHRLPEGGPDSPVILDVHPDHHEISASAVRSGRTEWHASHEPDGPEA